MRANLPGWFFLTCFAAGLTTVRAADPCVFGRPCSASVLAPDNRYTGYTAMPIVWPSRFPTAAECMSRVYYGATAPNPSAVKPNVRFFRPLPVDSCVWTRISSGNWQWVRVPAGTCFDYDIYDRPLYWTNSGVPAPVIIYGTAARPPGVVVAPHVRPSVPGRPGVRRAPAPGRPPPVRPPAAPAPPIVAVPAPRAPVTPAPSPPARRPPSPRPDLVKPEPKPPALPRPVTCITINAKSFVMKVGEQQAMSVEVNNPDNLPLSYSWFLESVDPDTDISFVNLPDRTSVAIIDTSRLKPGNYVVTVNITDNVQRTISCTAALSVQPATTRWWPWQWRWQWTWLTIFATAVAVIVLITLAAIAVALARRQRP